MCIPVKNGKIIPIILVLVVSVMVPLSADGQGCFDYRNTFREAGTWPSTGLVGGMDSDGDHALTMYDNQIHILDLSDPGAVAEVGTFELGIYASHVASQDRLAVVGSNSTLNLLDWSNPSSPLLLQTLAMPSGTENITRDGDYLFVSRGTLGVDIFECTAAGGLTLLGNIDTPGSVNDACLHEGWLVVADGEALLTVLISDPSDPIIIGSYSSYYVGAEDLDVHQVKSSEDQLVVASVRWQGEQFGGPTRGLDLMDVDAGGNLIHLDDMNFPGYDWPRYDLHNDWLFVSCNQEFRVIPLSDFPNKVAWLETGSSANPVVAGSSTALLQLASGGYDILDIRYPGFVTPEPAFSGNAFHDIGGGMVVDGFLLKDKTTWSGLVYSYDAYLYDVRNPEDIIEINHISGNGGPEDYHFSSISAVNGSRVMVSTSTAYGTGCSVYDLEMEPFQTVALPYGGEAVFDGTRLYQRAVDSNIGLAILDLSTPGLVTELGFVPGFLSYPPVLVAENLVAAMGSDFTLLDLSDPLVPIELGTIPGVGGRLLGRHGDFLFLKNNSGDFLCVDVGDPLNPVLHWQNPYMNVQTMDMEGDLALMTLSGSGDNFLQVYDLVSTPSSGPLPVSQGFTGGSNISEAIWSGDYAYTSDMQVFNMGDPSQPVLLGRGIGSGRGMYRNDNRIIMGGGCFPVQCTSSSSPVEENFPGPGHFLLNNSPNPFNPMTKISFDLARSTQVNLEVFDLAGRKINTLISEALGAGRHSVMWNGTDEGGRRVSSGTYFYRLRAEGDTQTNKMLLLK
ncbi:MAG: T9SS type A sorting domain-containing protein [bacterium]|nr:T9SS type A sorting domain-containing protein [bacterium]